MRWNIACRRHARPGKELRLLTATRSLSISTATCGRSNDEGNRSSRSTRRRRNWSGISRTAAASGNRRARLSTCARTTSRNKKLGKVIPYGVYDPTYNEGWVSVGIDHDTQVEQD